MPRIEFETKYGIGETVYFKTCTIGTPFLVVGYIVNPNYSVSYLLESGGYETQAHEFQLIPNKRIEGVEYN